LLKIARVHGWEPIRSATATFENPCLVPANPRTLSLLHLAGFASNLLNTPLITGPPPSQLNYHT
jgi:hypothetical protein